MEGMNIISKPITPKNYAVGRRDNKGNPVSPDCICIHVGVGSMQRIFNTFNNPVEERSAHYLVSKKGEVWYMVDEDNNAWAQGVAKSPTAQLVKERLATMNPNAFIISIENEGSGEDFTPEQYQANANLIADISKRRLFPIDRTHVIRHDEIRWDKNCPGLVSVDKLVEMAKGPEVQSCEVLVAEKQRLIDILIAWITRKFGA